VPSFEIGDSDFLLDREPLRIVSGALHYFRVHPEQWADRIEKARLMGLNTLETYVAWNHHSSRPGEFRTDGQRDLGRFLDLVAKAGLYAIVRPGPYICAEWTNGGFPAWLTADRSVAIRTSDPGYLAAVAGYYDAVAPVIVPRQVTRGGNILLVQVENEYGAYGSDQDYLKALVAMMRARGIDVPLTTADQPVAGHLKNGSVPGALATANFGARAAARLSVLREHQPTGPLMCGEFWNGWFDSLGQHHHTTDPVATAAELDALLAAGASVNLYMFHGGTNFGTTQGANDKGTYAPITTSYDYDAPLSESGAPTSKYAAFKEVIGRYVPVPAENPDPPAPAPAFTVPLRLGAGWPETLAQLGPWSRFDRLPTLEQLDPSATFAIYQVETDADALAFAEVRDRAVVLVDGQPQAVLNRALHERSVALPEGRHTVTLLVEDLGRVDYGPRTGEPKGLIGPVATNTGTAGQLQWRAAGIGHKQLDGLAWLGGAVALDPDSPVAGPVFLHCQFDAEQGADLFLDTTGWGHGLVWVNQFCLGRYHSAGPTHTIYVPGPLVKNQANLLVVWELAVNNHPEARFVAEPDLGHEEA
jgi:beta-galactosidase